MRAEGEGISPDPAVSNKPLIEESDLAKYLDTTLSATPSAEGIKNRQGAAAYLARAFFHKYGPPQELDWRKGKPVTAHKRSHPILVARCPEGHLVDEALETNQVIAWICEKCERLYNAEQCRLVPRKEGAI